MAKVYDAVGEVPTALFGASERGVRRIWRRCAERPLPSGADPGQQFEAAGRDTVRWWKEDGIISFNLNEEPNPKKTS